MPRTSSGLPSTTGATGSSLRSSLRLKGTSSMAVAKGKAGPPTGGLKRKASVLENNPKGAKMISSDAKTTKRAVFEDITNAGENDRKSNLKNTVKKGLTTIRSNFGGGVNKKLPPPTSKKVANNGGLVKGLSTKGTSKRPLGSQAPSTRLAEQKKGELLPSGPAATLLLQQPSLSRTSSLEDAKCMEGVSLSDEEIEETTAEPSKVPASSSPLRPSLPQGVNDFDLENAHDPNQCSLYAAHIFQYYKSREAQFAVSDYLKKGSHPEITETMRSILVDWLVEVQESFELNHETLYTSVKIFDLYLSLEKRPVKKDELQLIGATVCLIACKVDERLPPPLDDFVYVCDDAYTREQIIVMERKIIQTVNYDLGYPLSYRFLRRYGRVCSVSMPVLTLARYILEMSLMEYEFNIAGMSESKLAASALILAFKIHDCQGWVDTLKHYSGYSPAKDLKEIVMKLLKIIVKPRRPNLKTIRDKYSHIVFHEVALVKIPSDIDVDED